ncbi:hypothetical protein OO012_08670 [Rhodobacteraceae bacterium KMM 6894]|nr:hypothetical protein [Rhodobacteraceae bacterium KMM 6894]
MTAALLTRRTHHTPAALPVLGDIALPMGRVHEICGRARHRLALITAAATGGPVIWIAPRWQSTALNPDGMQALIGPERLIFVTPERPVDLLWCMEEALRSGAAALVVAEVPEPPGLTPVRRLHLAAETAGSGTATPLGLILTPGNGGAPGIETRWQMSPAHLPTIPRWHLTRARARTAPPCSWHVTGRPGHWHLTPLQDLPP